MKVHFKERLCEKDTGKEMTNMTCLVYACELPLWIKWTDTTTRHATNEYGGCVKIMKPFRLSHKPMGLVSVERVTV